MLKTQQTTAIPTQTQYKKTGSHSHTTVHLYTRLPIYLNIPT